MKNALIETSALIQKSALIETSALIQKSLFASPFLSALFQILTIFKRAFSNFNHFQFPLVLVYILELGYEVG